MSYCFYCIHLLLLLDADVGLFTVEWQRRIRGQRWSNVGNSERNRSPTANITKIYRLTCFYVGVRNLCAGLSTSLPRADWGNRARQCLLRRVQRRITVTIIRQWAIYSNRCQRYQPIREGVLRAYVIVTTCLSADKNIIWVHFCQRFCVLTRWSISDVRL